MKYHPTMYARAFWDVMQGVSASRQSEMIRNFASLISKNGDMAKAQEIIGEIERQYVKGHGGRIVKLEFAREQPENLVRQLKRGFTKNDLVIEAINKSLIAGVRVTIDGELELDNTMQRKLQRLFRN